MHTKAVTKSNHNVSQSGHHEPQGGTASCTSPRENRALENIPLAKNSGTSRDYQSPENAGSSFQCQSPHLVEVLFSMRENLYCYQLPLLNPAFQVGISGNPHEL